MPKSRGTRNAFTLIEVMVAVMIISVVIAALLEMRGNTSFKFFQIKEMMRTNQYSSFLLSQGDKYGFERSHLDMNRLIEDFDVESDLRRKLKAIKVEMDYEVVESIDTSEYDESAQSTQDDEEVQEDTTGIVFEIGKTQLKTKEYTLSLLRVRLQ